VNAAPQLVATEYSFISVWLQVGRDPARRNTTSCIMRSLMPWSCQSILHT
jgi:hypothetical protein